MRYNRGLGGMSAGKFLLYHWRLCASSPRWRSWPPRRPRALAPFAWSTYSLQREGDLFVYRQLVGAADGGTTRAAAWTGRETVAFRLHVPSKIADHNAGPENLKRGNILVWEQSLADR